MSIVAKPDEPTSDFHSIAANAKRIGRLAGTLLAVEAMLREEKVSRDHIADSVRRALTEAGFGDLLADKPESGS